MTFSEKEVVIRALRSYSDQQTRKAKNAEKQGESGKASQFMSESEKASGLMHVFAGLLTVPSGEGRI